MAASASASSSAAAAAGEQLWTTLSQVSASLEDLAASSGPAVLYLAVVTTALCNWLQTVGQARIGAEQAALIYALDPVWGAFFARILCGDELGGEGIAGGALIVIAAIGSQFLADSKTNPLSSEAEADSPGEAAAAIGGFGAAEGEAAESASPLGSCGEPGSKERARYGAASTLTSMPAAQQLGEPPLQNTRHVRWSSQIMSCS